MDRRVIENPFAPATGTSRDAVEYSIEGFAVERIVEEDDEIAAREPRPPRVGADQSDVPAANRQAACAREVVARDAMQAGRELDAQDVGEGILARQQHGAAHARTDVDEGRAGYRGRRHAFHQRRKEPRRYGFIVRGVRARVTGGLGIEVAQEEQGVRRNAVLAVEAASGPGCAHAHGDRVLDRRCRTMLAMRRPYCEGDVFAVPLGDQRFGAGIVAAGAGRVVSGYFFARAYDGIPAASDLGRLEAAQAVWSCRLFDRGLHEARWPVLRGRPPFDPTAWPKLEGPALEPGIVEFSLAQRLSGAPAARPRFGVWDVRSPLGVHRLDVLPPATRLQWRAPLAEEDLAAVARATAAGRLSVRLYGAACAQAPRVAAWPQLARLAVDAAHLPASLPVFPHVGALALDGVPADLAATLARFPNVTDLHLRARGGSVDAAAFAAAPCLERLAVADAALNAAGSIAALPALATLDLHSTSLDDDVAFSARRLRSLRLSSMSGLTSIEGLRDRPHLAALVLENLTCVDDVRAIATLPNLTSLELTGMWQLRVDDVAFIAALPALSRLKLDIGGRRKNLEIYRRRPLAEPLAFGRLTA